MSRQSSETSANNSSSSSSSSSTSSWNWNTLFSNAQELASKAAELAEAAKKEANLLVQKVQENYDVEDIKKSIGLSSSTTTDNPLLVTGQSQPTKVNTTNSKTTNSKSISNSNNNAASYSVGQAQSLDLVYITENIIAMPFPYDMKNISGHIEEGNDIHLVSNFLNTKHSGHYMIWNISEETYNYQLFEDQVLDYKFPGHPSPPLGLLFKICTSIESWLDADDKNVAVIHCLTGKGRTAALISCVLTWIGELRNLISLFVSFFLSLFLSFFVCFFLCIDYLLVLNYLNKCTN